MLGGAGFGGTSPDNNQRERAGFSLRVTLLECNTNPTWHICLSNRKKLMNAIKQKLTLDRPVTYQIKVPGELDDSWSEW